MGPENGKMLKPEPEVDFFQKKSAQISWFPKND
jgi:hypothetical protein